MNIGAVTRCIKILYRQPDPLVVCLGCRRPQRVCFRGQAEMLCAVRTSSRSGTRRVLPECNLYIYIYTHSVSSLLSIVAVLPLLHHEEYKEKMGLMSLILLS